jgi:hypothetical protein
MQCIMQVYALSDLHVDVASNMEWVEKYCRVPKEHASAYTVMVCAGDVSADLKCVKRAFQILADNYDAVCFVPGNHDAWRRTEVPGDTSVAKLRDLISLAQQCDVHVGPLHVHSTEAGRSILSVYPLYAWYHSSWDGEPDLADAASLAREKECPFKLKWSDFRRCVWPHTKVDGMDFVTSFAGAAAPSSPSSPAAPPPSLSSMFAKLNEPFILKAVAEREKRAATAAAAGAKALPSPASVGSECDADADAAADVRVAPAAVSVPKTPVITFSHFLPRQECCIEKRFLTEQLLMKVFLFDET